MILNKPENAIPCYNKLINDWSETGFSKYITENDQIDEHVNWLAIVNDRFQFTDA